MKTGPDQERGGLTPAASFERNLAMLARTDALRRRRALAAASGIDRGAARVVPLAAILPFAILGGMHSA